MEKIKTLVYEDAAAGSKYVAGKIRELIEANNKLGKKTVLGLATGSSPLKLYAELIRMHKEESLSFANVVTFACFSCSLNRRYNTRIYSLLNEFC